MRTEITDDPRVAARFLQRGEVVVFPTETVWGAGADALDDAAVARVFAAKGRPADNPLIVHLAAPANRAALAEVAALDGPSSIELDALLARFCPGPLTLVLPRHPCLPAAVSAGLPTVAVRFVAQPLAAALITAAGRPVAAPSANRSGRPSPTDFHAAFAEMEGRVACILRGPPSQIGLESTVLDCTGAAPLLLRRGAVSLAQLRAVDPRTRELGETAGADELARRSPGTRHRHYAPRVPVFVVDAPPDAPPPGAVWIGLASPTRPETWMGSRRFDDVAAYARGLFAAFRWAEALGASSLWCAAVPAEGLGAALMDRLGRAADAGAAPEDSDAQAAALDED